MFSNLAKFRNVFCRSFGKIIITVLIFISVLPLGASEWSDHIEMWHQFLLLKHTALGSDYLVMGLYVHVNVCLRGSVGHSDVVKMSNK
jgi:hypothetical protein